eukprot:TRINITY_DN782_c0_g1_i1.p2 TRINITY_DN782_c0_g1~~TRINITY_DN782_c0_g1_i1.p2  ORF type:complete len:237 (+),score=25.36 TRINITY_DN782_c0_g1_i1:1165-1875(+)
MKNCKEVVEELLRESTIGKNSTNTSIEETNLLGAPGETAPVLRKASCTDYQVFPLDPVLITAKAYERVEAIGSATAVVCVLKDDELICANLGDSGFRLYRLDNFYEPTLVMKSEPQVHEGEAPYQLCRPPPARLIKGESSIDGQWDVEYDECYKDPPESAKVYQMKVQSGDLLVLGTDGLFDNLFDDKLLSMISVLGRQKTSEIAKQILETAYDASMDPNARTPYSVREYKDKSTV